jgi:hypothetical protein
MLIIVWWAAQQLQMGDSRPLAIAQNKSGSSVEAVSLGRQRSKCKFVRRSVAPVIVALLAIPLLVTLTSQKVDSFVPVYANISGFRTNYRVVSVSMEIGVLCEGRQTVGSGFRFVGRLQQPDLGKFACFQGQICIPRPSIHILFSHTHTHTEILMRSRTNETDTRGRLEIRLQMLLDMTKGLSSTFSRL